MKPLRSCWMAVALLCVAACADLAGEDGYHRDCVRKPIEAKPAPTMGPAAPRKAVAPAPHEVAPEAPCGHDDEPQAWDGTGRAEAVRGT